MIHGLDTRLLDTLLAATYQQAGIQSILTTDQTDFAVFGVFNCIRPNLLLRILD